MAAKPLSSLSPWARAVCRANGLDIHYWRTGGNKPVLVLLHGLSENAACWTAVARALQNRYDVIMPDARGHGLSSSPLHGYTYFDHAMDVIELIRALKVTSPYLLGHGMGGMTAAMVASRLGLAVGGIVLADPTFISHEAQGEVYARDKGMQHLQLLRRSKDSVVAAERVRHPRIAAELISQIVEAKLQTSMSAFDVLIPPHPEFKELVRNIYVPTLLLLGSEGMVSVDTAADLHTLNSGLQYQLIADTGLGLIYDKPLHVAAAVDAFLRPSLRGITQALTREKPVSQMLL